MRAFEKQVFLNLRNKPESWSDHDRRLDVQVPPAPTWLTGCPTARPICWIVTAPCENKRISTLAKPDSRGK